MYLYLLTSTVWKFICTVCCAVYAVGRGRFNITVNLDYLHAHIQGKLASVC